MKSIRTKITLCLILTVLVGQAASGVASIFLNYNGTMSTVEQMMCETAVLAADRVEQELLAYKVAVMDTGCIPQLSDPSVPIDEKQAIINERVTMHGFQRGNIIGKDGISIFDGKDYSDREYVQQAMQGNIFVSEPLISKITGELSIMVAAPLYTDGVYGSSIAQNKRMNKNKQTFVAKIMQQYHYTFHSYPFDEILRSMNKTGKIS